MDYIHTLNSNTLQNNYLEEELTNFNLINILVKQHAMKTNRRSQESIIPLLIGLFLILPVSSCFSPHYRDYKGNDPEPPEIFQPIPVERANGLYATVGYLPSADSSNIELEAEPTITPSDIKELRKTTLYSGTYPVIEVKLNEKGSEKLFLLTKENIGKPVAFVVESKIIAMPMVMAATVDGEFFIAGGFPEDEIERIIDILKEAQEK